MLDQIVRDGGSLAQVHHLIATFADRRIGLVEGRIKLGAQLRIYPLADGLKAQDGALHALQQGVVQIARDTLALRDAHFGAFTHAFGNLAHA